MARRILFASVVTGLERRSDPVVPQGLGVHKGPGEKNDAAKPTSLGNVNGLLDCSASPSAKVGVSKTVLLCWFA